MKIFNLPSSSAGANCGVGSWVYYRVRVSCEPPSRRSSPTSPDSGNDAGTGSTQVLVGSSRALA